MISFVTTNKGKFLEVSKLLEEESFDCEMLYMEYPEIQSESLEEVVENALDWLSNMLKGDFLIDDSGLFIDYLNGFPGVYSSYVYHTIGLDGMLRIMEGVDEREAEFRCCLGLRWKGEKKLFLGVVRGRLARKRKGKEGFGFDPIFIPTGEERTFAEVSSDEKNKRSHRGKAIEKMLDFLKSHRVP